MAKVKRLGRKKEIRCGVCGSVQIMFKKTENYYWCRRCGARFDRKFKALPGYGFKTREI